MSKVTEIQKVAVHISKYHKDKSKITLIGGCFDILHIGHIYFLKKAKGMGDILIILLESDKKVKMLKGEKRPFHSQKARAQILSSLYFVDLVVMLPALTKDSMYKDLIDSIKPHIIAVTQNDPLLNKKRKQARSIGAKLKIISYLETASSSKLANLLGID